MSADPEGAPRLVDLACAKEYLGIAATECRYDLAVAMMLERASSIVEEHLAAPVLRTARTHYFSGDGCSVHVLPYRKVNAVMSVELLGCVGESSSALPTADYDLFPTGYGFAVRHRVRWELGEPYAAVLDIGYDAVPVPVREAVLVVLAGVVARSNVEGLGLARAGVARHGEAVPGTTAGDVNGTPTATVVPAAAYITEELRAVLAPYRKMGMPW